MLASQPSSMLLMAGNLSLRFCFCSCVCRVTTFICAPIGDGVNVVQRYSDGMDKRSCQSACVVVRICGPETSSAYSITPRVVRLHCSGQSLCSRPANFLCVLLLAHDVRMGVALIILSAGVAQAATLI